MAKNTEALQGGEKAALYLLAEQLLDNEQQLAHYDTAKWNMVGDPNPDRRREGRMPWLTRRDGQGALRAYTLDVFSGFSTDTSSILTIRKDLWRDPDDPATWLALETNLETGDTMQHAVRSVHVDAARRMWMEVTPPNPGSAQPQWHEGGMLRTALHERSPMNQARFIARLDKNWQASRVDYRNGPYASPAAYEDIVALESMIIAVQQLRMAAQEAETMPVVQYPDELATPIILAA